MSVDFFPVPMTELLFTQRCNMACKYCFEPEKQENKMTKMQMLDFAENLPSNKIMMFGGEPLIDMDLFTTLHDAISAKELNEVQKTQLLQSFTVQGSLITNGTLIEKNIDILKKYKVGLQISVDGPKEINDLQRVYKNGSGTFDDVMSGVDLCIENDIPWSIHGAITAASFTSLPAVFSFFWEVAKKQTKGNLDAAIGLQGGNSFQIIFEDEYSDADIDNFLVAQEQVFNLILDLQELTEKQRITLLQGWFTRHGSACIAGNTLFAVDPDLNVYPCHRPGMSKNRAQNSLGNLKDRNTFTNFKLFNTFLTLDRGQHMFSAVRNIKADEPKGFAFQQNWCPAANLETSGTPFYQSSKYNLMIVEYDRFVREIFEYAKIPLPNTN